MMHDTRRWLTALVLILAGPGGGQALAAVPDDTLAIGAASLVVPNVSGRIGEVTRTISVEDNVFADEVINTADQGATRIVFEDDTELTVGANSTVVLDRFVYDPNAGAGSLVVEMLKGVFEFNSGNLPNDAYELNTPSATLAIRGTSITIIVTPSLTVPGTYDLNVKVNEGAADITYTDSGGVTRVLSLTEGEGADIKGLPLPEFAALGGTTTEITVETCSGEACSEGVFAEADRVLALDLLSIIAQAVPQDVEPGAGGGLSTNQRTFPFNSGGSSGGGGGGPVQDIDGVSDF